LGRFAAPHDLAHGGGEIRITGADRNKTDVVAAVGAGTGVIAQSPAGALTRSVYALAQADFDWCFRVFAVNVKGSHACARHHQSRRSRCQRETVSLFHMQLHVKFSPECS
jgi:hypothetical protein